MSYILDALDKAAAQRRQHSVLPPPATPVARPGSGPRGRRTVLALTGLGLLGAGAVGWWALGRPAAKPASPTPAAVLAPAVEAPAVVNTAPAAAPPPILAPEKPNPVASASAARQVATPTVASTPSAAPVAPPDTLNAAPVAPAPAPATGAAPTPGPAPAAPVLATVPAGVPPLAISGSSYSENPAHRLLIVNGKVVQEGQEVAPGLRLEILTAQTAVFNHRGLRFNLSLP